MTKTLEELVQEQLGYWVYPTLEEAEKVSKEHWENVVL